MKWFVRIALVGLAAVALSIAATDARAATPATTVTAPVEGFVYNECTGHVIEFSGVEHVVYRIVDDEETGFLQHHILSFVLAGVHVVDTVTGETYILNQTSTYALHLYPAGSAVILNAEGTGVFVAGTSSFSGKYLLHTTINPDGTTTVNFQIYELTCM